MRVRLATESATKGIDCIDRSSLCAATVTRYCCGINTHGFSNRSKRNVRKGRTRRRTLRPPCCNDGSRTGAHRTRRNRSSREGARSGSTRQARLDMLSARWPHRSPLRRRVLAAPANRDEDLAEGVSAIDGESRPCKPWQAEPPTPCFPRRLNVISLQIVSGQREGRW